MSSDAGTLRRVVGLWAAVLSGTGVIVGAGIYVLVGEAAGLAGNGAWLGFLLASIVAAFTAVTYARMGKRVPKDSPEFQYGRVGLGFRGGFLAGWLMIWADVVSVAAVSLGFAGYFHSLTGVPIVPAGLGLLAVLSLLTWVGIRESILLVGVLSLLEMAGLVLVIAVGIPHWGEQPLLDIPKGPSGVWSAAALVFFAYLGFDELGNLAEEMRTPEKDLPRAIVLAMIISTALYIMTAVSAISLVGWQVLSASDAPLADAIQATLGPTWRTALALIALAATGSTVLLLLVSVSRSLFGMAVAGALPTQLRQIGNRRTPWVSILVAWAISSLFLLVGNIVLVAQATNFLVLVAFILVNLSLLMVLRKELGKGSSSPILRVVWYLQPVLGILTCLWLLAVTGWTAAVVGIVLAFMGLAVGKWMEVRGTGRNGAPGPLGP